MKTPEELKELKEEFENLSLKLHEMSEEEFEQVGGGIAPGRPYWKNGMPKPKNTKSPDSE